MRIDVVSFLSLRQTFWISCAAAVLWTPIKTCLSVLSICNTSKFQTKHWLRNILVTSFDIQIVRLNHLLLYLVDVRDCRLAHEQISWKGHEEGLWVEEMHGLVFSRILREEGGFGSEKKPAYTSSTGKY